MGYYKPCPRCSNTGGEWGGGVCKLCKGTRRVPVAKTKHIDVLVYVDERLAKTVRHYEDESTASFLRRVNSSVEQLVQGRPTK